MIPVMLTGIVASINCIYFEERGHEKLLDLYHLGQPDVLSRQ